MKRDVKGFCNYAFDQELNIYNKKTGDQMKFYLDKDGYVITVLRKDLKSYHKKVHRLVAITFIENPENKPEVNHINGIRNDYRIQNLQWVTRSENNRHAFASGNHNHKGENHPQNKLTNQIVKDIFKLAAMGWTQQKIADKYGRHQTTINDVLRRKTWPHVKI